MINTIYDGATNSIKGRQISVYPMFILMLNRKNNPCNIFVTRVFSFMHFLNVDARLPFQ